jgi:squalene-hopene/tetraprenyl-beta-curcumene cyclase
MKSPTLLTTTLALIFGGDLCPAADGPDFQYRFERKSIPAAGADEPLRMDFDSVRTRDHLDTAVVLWAGRQHCVSCHTHGLYMMTRPALSVEWGRPDESVRDFVVAEAAALQEAADWSGSVPVQLAYIARGLAIWDAHLRQTTSPETAAALKAAFETQAEDGSIRAKDRWPSLNATTYHATVMLAMATAEAPAWIDMLDDAELRARVTRLHTFLRDSSPKNDHDRLLLLWASTRLPDLLTSERRAELVDGVWQRQLPDGGWSIWNFAKPEELRGGRRALSIQAEPDYTHPRSDGYQTGLAVVVLRDAGVSADDERIQKAVHWLLTHQRESGRWWTRSLNVSSRFHFVSYSGTAYAALALSRCNALPAVSD